MSTALAARILDASFAAVRDTVLIGFISVLCPRPVEVTTRVQAPDQDQAMAVTRELFGGSGRYLEPLGTSIRAVERGTLLADERPKTLVHGGRSACEIREVAIPYGKLLVGLVGAHPLADKTV